MDQFFDSKANRIGIISLQSAATAFAFWQIAVGGPYQGLAITLLIPTTLLLMALSVVQLKKHF